MEGNKPKGKLTTKTLLIVLASILSIVSLWLFVSFKEALNYTPKNRALKCSETILSIKRSPNADFEIHIVRQDCKLFWDYLSVQLLNNATEEKTEILAANNRVMEKEIQIDWEDRKTVTINYAGSLDALNNLGLPSYDTLGIKINITTNRAHSDY
jgi:hypothetical protein